MPTAIMHPQRRHTRQRRHGRRAPPAPRHHANVQPVPVPPPADDGPHGAEAGRHALPQAVDRAEHARVRAAVVEQDDAGGQREGAGRDLQQEHPQDAEPDKGAARRGWGFGRRGQYGEVRADEVGDGEEEEEPAEGADGAQAGLDGGVERDLEDHAYDAEERSGHANRGSRHTEATCEQQRKRPFLELSLLIKLHRGVVSRCREKQRPDIRKGAKMEVVKSAGNECKDDIASPQS